MMFHARQNIFLLTFTKFKASESFEVSSWFSEMAKWPAILFKKVEHIKTVVTQNYDIQYDIQKKPHDHTAVANLCAVMKISREISIV